MSVRAWNGIASLTFIISFVIVSISPAICEEAVFRGVVMHSFDNGKNKWIAIVVTGLIFGAFHGNIWRFVPTALLGIMLGYIVYETDNIIYGSAVSCNQQRHAAA